MASDIQYDPTLVQKLANKLYAQANSIVASVAFLGLLIAGVAGYVVGGEIGALVGAFIGGLLGYIVGQSRAFTLRLQAQQALCQIYIEANTRRP